MTQKRRFINEIDKPPVHGGSTPLGSSHEPLEVSLETAKLAKSNTLVPTHIPAGYVLSWVNVSRDSTRVMLFYSNESNELHQHGHLMIVQGGSLSPRGVRVKRGHAEAVEFQSGDNAHVIRGGWVPTDPHDEFSDLEWKQEASRTLFFERSEGLILLHGEPASAWSASALKKVANSLQPA